MKIADIPKLATRVIGLNTPTTGYVLEQTTSTNLDVVFYSKNRGKGASKQLHQKTIASGIDFGSVVSKEDVVEFDAEIREIIKNDKLSKGQTYNYTPYSIRGNFLQHFYS